MAIETFGNGGFTVTGEHVNLYAMLAQRSALGLEMRGLKLSRGVSVYALVKKRYGFKGNKASVAAQLDAAIEAYKQQIAAN